MKLVMYVEAHGIATLLTKQNTVAFIYILSDVLHTRAKLQRPLQCKGIQCVRGVVESTTKWLAELTEMYVRNVQGSFFSFH